MTTPPATSNLAPTRPPGTAPGRAVTATLAALLGGMALGALDDALATWWAWAAHSLANSAGAWVLACFLVAWFAKTTRGAATRGLACLVGLVAGFYLVAPLHTPPPSNGLLPFWLVVAAIVGPLIGLAAGTARRGRPRWATVAAVTVGSVIAVDALLQGISGKGASPPPGLLPARPRARWCCRAGKAVPRALSRVHDERDQHQ